LDTKFDRDIFNGVIRNWIIVIETFRKFESTIKQISDEMCADWRVPFVENKDWDFTRVIRLTNSNDKFERRIFNQTNNLENINGRHLDLHANNLTKTYKRFVNELKTVLVPVILLYFLNIFTGDIHEGFTMPLSTGNVEWSTCSLKININDCRACIGLRLKIGSTST